MRQITAPRPAAESLGARIVRRASEARLAPPPPRARPRPQAEHEYVRDRGRALAVIREHAELRAELAQKLGRIEGAVIGFRMLRATPPLGRGSSVRIGGGGDWASTPQAIERVERPPSTRRRGRPGRRGRLVAALARSRTG